MYIITNNKLNLILNWKAHNTPRNATDLLIYNAPSPGDLVIFNCLNGAKSTEHYVSSPDSSNKVKVAGNKFAMASNEQGSSQSELKD